MADDVPIKFVGNSADAERAIAQLERKYDSLEQKIKRLKTTAKPDAGGNLLSSMSTGAMSLASSLTGVSSGVTLITQGVALLAKEWQNVIDRQNKALEAHKKFASPLEQMIFNTQGDAEFRTVASREAEVERIFKATGVSREQVAMTVGEAASAKGDLPLRRVFDTVESTMRLLPNTPAAQPVAAASALDVLKDLPYLDAADPLGMQIAIGATSRVKDNEAIARNAMPAIIGMTSLDRMEREDLIREGKMQRPDEATTRRLEDESMRANAAAFSAITQTSTDTEGKFTRTGLTAAQLQLDEFFRGREELNSLDTFAERLEFMQNNPAATKAFFEGGDFGGKKSKGFQFSVTGPNGEQLDMTADRASFEKKVLPSMRGLFTKDSSTDRFYRQAMKELPLLSEGDRLYSETVAEMQTSPTLQIADQDRRLAGAADRGFFGDTSGATSAAIRDKLFGDKGALKAAGYGDVSQTTARAEYDARTLFQSPSDAAKAVIEPLVKNIESNYGLKPLGLSGEGSQANAQVLRDILVELQKISGNTEKAANRKPQPIPNRPANPEAN